MGRDYSYWTGKKVRGGGGGDGGGDASTTTPSGCMSTVFRFFDFHHFQLCYSLNHLNHHANPETLHPNSTLSFTQESLKGVEAPRNSFESAHSINEPPVSDNLSIPQVSKIHIKTKRGASNSPLNSSTEEFSEDSLSSPGARTPSLVARLMGLDLLPESSSPAYSISSAKLQTHPTRKPMKSSGTQSLPDSPRTSLTRLSDVDLHHRLSLQVSKEGNCKPNETCKRREMIKNLVQNSEAEGWSPSHYAKQIVKQVKENAGKRVGLAEITNTVRNRQTEQRRDEHLLSRAKTLPLQSKKTNLSSVDSENRPPTSSSNKLHLSATPPLTTSSPKTVQVEKIKCRKGEEDKFKFTTCSAAANSKKSKPSSSTVNQKQKKNPLKVKKTPVSTEQFNITIAARTNLNRIKQVGSGSGQSQRRNSELQKTHIYVNPESAAAKYQTLGGHEIHYVSKILKYMGIGNHTPVTIHNSASPLNPTIFHLLEPISSTILKSNRLLIFQLVDEILTEIFNPTSSLAVRCGRGGSMNGAQLLKLLTAKMDAFPLSNCEDLADVDALVGSDYRAEAVDDERESVVRDIEREILDCLLTETASLVTLHLS